MRRLTLLVAVAVCAAVLAGCGNSQPTAISSNGVASTGNQPIAVTKPAETQAPSAKLVAQPAKKYPFRITAVNFPQPRQNTVKITIVNFTAQPVGPFYASFNGTEDGGDPSGVPPQSVSTPDQQQMLEGSSTQIFKVDVLGPKNSYTITVSYPFESTACVVATAKLVAQPQLTPINSASSCGHQ
jgi:hypothetical protein